MILDEIVENKRKEIAVLKEAIKLPLKGKLPQLRSFFDAVSKPGFNIIAETKASSPSAGKIVKKYDPAKIAISYEKAGAAAISVLTDKKYFSGDIHDLMAVKKAVKLPVLRKDFIIDESQIYQSRLLGADAILLIVRILRADELELFIRIAGDLEMDCLVEVHDAREAQTALDCGAEIIGINNRDLDTLEVDVNNTPNIINAVPFLKEKVLVSESGIKTKIDIELLRSAEVNAALIGESLLKSGDIAGKINELFD